MSNLNDFNAPEFGPENNSPNGTGNNNGNHNGNPNGNNDNNNNGNGPKKPSGQSALRFETQSRKSPYHDEYL